MNRSLNLARAWRSKTFDEIVGQELSVRLVKNSLYKNQLFPVYLIAGQRGCGKTTLGRVFAAALNCAQRETFTRSPRETVLPCLVCTSCEAMRSGNHPDFYEIDAASHTGVDNVRALIETASLLPALGQKKIYLIDEAHMLSKAAFNAFLKILEEPPASVLFMLATTDPHKIIDTVRSRCFQLFIDPLSPEELTKHLAYVCTRENIIFEEPALRIIAHESSGSVRDALNSIERLHLAHGKIHYDDTIKTLGNLGYDQVIALCEAAFCKGEEAVIALLEELELNRLSPLNMWKKMIEVLRALMWARYGRSSQALALYHESLKKIAATSPTQRFVDALEIWYNAEPLFVKTHAPHALIETLVMRMVVAPRQPMSGGGSPERSATSAPQRVTATTPGSIKSEAAEVKPQASEAKTAKESGPWQEFMRQLILKQDPLVLSVFKQGTLASHEGNRVIVIFAESLSFFKELIFQTEGLWQPVLSAVFGPQSVLEAEFTSQNGSAPTTIPSPKSATPVVVKSTQPPPMAVPQRTERPKPVVQAQRVDVSDTERYKNIHALLAVFPGSVTEERDVV